MKFREAVSIVAIGAALALVASLALQAIAATGCSFAVAGKGKKSAVVCPSDVTMPDVLVGSFRDTVLVLRNTGNAPWSGTLTLDAQTVQAYTIVAGGGVLTIPARGTWPFTLRFIPPDSLSYSCRPRAQ